MNILPAELSLAARAKSPISETNNKLSVEQPCAFLEDCCCTVYADRYDVCRQFRCKLLLEVDSGKVSSESATICVAKAKQLRDQAKTAFASVGHHDLSARSRDAVAGWAGLTDPAQRLAMAQIQLSLAALESYLQKYFRTSAAKVSGSAVKT